MKLMRTPYGYYDITTRASYEVNSYMDRAADLTEFRVWFVQLEHPECDHEGNRTHTRLTDNFTSRADAVAELDRIAALISGTAPAQGWVKGAPPKDGAWRVVAYNRLDDGTPSAGVARWDDARCAFFDDGGALYSVTITYHQPTPIVLP